MNSRLRRGLTALCLAAALTLAGASARAVETGPGTKNFNVPAGVPDHFSNEAEPFAASPAAEGPPPRSTVSRGARSRYVVGRRGRRVLVRGRVAHGRVVHGHVVVSRRGHGLAHTASRSLHGRSVSHSAKTASRPHPAAAKRHG